MAELSGFNKAQQEAILHVNGPCLVLAGPGSGKTTVITRRLIHMIKSCNIPPQGILVVTFTKSAANEMELRFSALLGSKLPVCFGTFHAIFFKILREQERDAPPALIKDKDKKDLITSIMKRHKVALKEYSRITDIFSKIKNGSGPEAFKEYEDLDLNRLKLMFMDYRRFCSDNHLLDFDDMAYNVLQLFKRDQNALKHWQGVFSHILIDEYQDISPIQEKIVGLLTMPHNNLFVVGDDDQSIYGFRGAGTELMLGFPDRYKGAKVINLNVNYRSCPSIINAAQKVIKENKKRYEKIQKPANESCNDKNAFLLKSYKTRKEQYDELITTLRQLQREDALTSAAVLYRKNNDADHLVELLKNAKIPFERTGKEMTVFNHFITEDITAYLNYIHGDNSRKTFYMIMNRPHRGIDREAAQNPDRVYLQEIARYHSREKNVVEAIIKLSKDRKKANPLSIYGAIMYIRKQMGYEEFLRSSFKGLLLEENLEILDILQNLSRSVKDLKGWVALINGDEDISLQDKEKEPGVKIMTYHGSKGLEFDRVYLPDLNEGTVPHSKAINEEQTEEERRMFYVAMTRAKKQLTLMYVEGTRQEPIPPSRFLNPFL